MGQPNPWTTLLTRDDVIQTRHGSIHASDIILLPTALAKKSDKIGRVRPRLFPPYLLNWLAFDLNFCICIWTMTIPHRGLKIKVMGQGYYKECVSCNRIYMRDMNGFNCVVISCDLAR